MPDFSRYSNYTEQTSFSGVRFGANAPVLEVEMNEFQQIIRTNLKRVSAYIGTAVFPAENGSVVFNDETKELTLTNCIALAGALSAFIPSAKMTLATDTSVAYVKLTESLITGVDTLKAYGDVANGEEIPNPIYDSRVGAETSRRYVITFEVGVAAELPMSSDESIAYIKVGEINEDGEYTPATTGGTLSEIVESAIEEATAQIGGVRKEIEAKLLVSNWTDTEDGSDYPYQYHIADAEVTAEMLPDVIFHEDSLAVCAEAGVSQVSYTYDGGILVKSAKMPEEDINCTVRISIKGSVHTGGGGSSYVLPTATPTRLGGIKTGTGLSSEPDGTTRVDGQSIAEDITPEVTDAVIESAGATDDEAKDMMDDVFGNTSVDDDFDKGKEVDEEF